MFITIHIIHEITIIIIIIIVSVIILITLLFILLLLLLLCIINVMCSDMIWVDMTYRLIYVLHYDMTRYIQLHST